MYIVHMFILWKDGDNHSRSRSGGGILEFIKPNILTCIIFGTDTMPNKD